MADLTNSKTEQQTEPKKSGTTRIGIIIVAGVMALVSVPVIGYVIKADAIAIGDVAKISLGALVGYAGSVITHYFNG